MQRIAKDLTRRSRQPVPMWFRSLCVQISDRLLPTPGVAPICLDDCHGRRHCRANPVLRSGHLRRWRRCRLRKSQLPSYRYQRYQPPHRATQGSSVSQRGPTGSNGATCSNAFQRGHRFSDSLEDLNCCCLGYLPLLHWLHVVAFFSANVPFKLHKRVTS